MIEIIALVLAAVTLLIVSVVVLFRSVLQKSREVDRMKQIFQGTVKKVASVAHVCPHQFGYLNSFPKSKPIPSECMGCSDISECLSHKKKRKK